MFGHPKKCYGSTTVGERGQIVLPAELREKLAIKTGDKFLVIGSEKKNDPEGVVVLIKGDVVAKFVSQLKEFSK